MTTTVKVFFHFGPDAEGLVKWAEDEANTWLQTYGRGAQVTMQTQMTYDDGDWFFTLSLVVIHP